MGRVIDGIESLILDSQEKPNDISRKEYVTQLYYLENELHRSSPDDVKKHVGRVEQKLFRVLLSSAIPPGPLIRESVSRCFHTLYTIGDSRTFFDTLAKLQKTISEKGLCQENRIAAIYVLGVLSELHGFKTLALFSESVSQLSRLLRKESSPALLLECAVALERVFIGQGRAATEGSLKDALKAAKYSLLYEKSPAVKAAALRFYAAIYSNSRLSKELGTIAGVELLAVSALKACASFLDSKLVSKALSLFVGTLYKEAICNCEARSADAGRAREVSQAHDGTAEGDDAGASEKRLGNALEAFVNDAFSSMGTLLLKQSHKRKSKEVLLGAFETMLTRLGSTWVDLNVELIARHALRIAGDAKWKLDPENAQYGRIAARAIVRDGLKRTHTDGSRLSLLKFLYGSEGILSTQHCNVDVLIVILEEIACLIRELGPLAASLFEDLRASLLQIDWSEPWNGGQAVTDCQADLLTQALTHSFQSLALFAPVDLPMIFDGLLAALQKHKARVLPLATVLAGLISLLKQPEMQIYVPYSLLARLFALGMDFVKSDDGPTGGSFLLTLALQVQAGWTVIGALLGLSPSVVKVYLPPVLLQLSTLFPKPTSQQGTSTAVVPSLSTNVSEWVFLLSSRESAISAMVSLIGTHMGSLIQLDLCKRLVHLLNNALAFLCTLPSLKDSSELAASGSSASNVNGNKYACLLRLESQLKTRLFQCYLLIEPSSTFEATRSALQSLCRDTFLPPAVGEETIHLSTLVYRELENANLVDLNQWYDSEASDFDRLTLYSPFAAKLYAEGDPPLLPRAETVCLDASILLFAKVFMQESAAQQEQRLEQFLRFFKTVNCLPAKTVRLCHNTVKAHLLIALWHIARAKAGAVSSSSPVVVGSGTSRPGDSWLAQATPSVLELFKQLALLGLEGDFPPLKLLGSLLIGLISRHLSVPDVQALLQQFIDKIVAESHSPDSRATSALAIGAICSAWGNLSSTVLRLNTVFSVLQSLALDPHPKVHAFSLSSLALVVGDCGYALSSFNDQLFLLIFKLLNSPEHSVLSNFDACFDTQSVLSGILASMLNTMGPELVLYLGSFEPLLNHFVHVFREETVVHTLNCLQHMITFSFKSDGQTALVIKKSLPYLQAKLDCGGRVSDAAVTVLYQLTKQDAKFLLQGTQDVMLQFFLLLSAEDRTNPEIKDVLLSLFKSCLDNIKVMEQLELLVKLFSRDFNSRPDSAKAASAPSGLPDVMSLNTPLYSTSLAIAGRYDIKLRPVKWETQEYAIVCLRSVLELLSESGPSCEPHFDLYKARASGKKHWAVCKLSEMVKLGFATATSQVERVKLQGLWLLKLLVRLFGTAMDPEFEGHALIEQYQAQFGSALSPALAETVRIVPQITCTACEVCASYIIASSKTYTNSLASLARVSKLLVGALSWQLSSSAVIETRVQLSVANSWAGIYLASMSGVQILTELVEPHISSLASLWISLLYAYSSVLSGTVAKPAGDGFTVLPVHQSDDAGLYFEAMREHVLPIYGQAWLQLYKAVSLVVSQADGSVVTLGWLKSLPSNSFKTLTLQGLEFLSRRLGAGGDLDVSLNSDVDNSQSTQDGSAVCKLQIGQFLVALCPFICRYDGFGEEFEGQPLGDLFALFDRVFQVESNSNKQALVHLLAKMIDSHLLLDSPTGEKENFTADFGAKRFTVGSTLLRYFFFHFKCLSVNPTSMTDFPNLANAGSVSELLSVGLKRGMSENDSAISVYAKLQIFVVVSVLYYSGRTDESFSKLVASLQPLLVKDEASDHEIGEFLLGCLPPTFPRTKLVEADVLIAGLLLGDASSLMGKHARLLEELLSLLDRVCDAEDSAASSLRVQGFQCCRSVLTSLVSGSERMQDFGVARLVLHRILKLLAGYLCSCSRKEDCDIVQGAVQEALRCMVIFALQLPESLARKPKSARLLGTVEFLLATAKASSPQSAFSKTIFQLLFQLAKSQQDVLKPVIAELDPGSKEFLQSGFKSLIS